MPPSNKRHPGVANLEILPLVTFLFFFLISIKTHMDTRTRIYKFIEIQKKKSKAIVKTDTMNIYSITKTRILIAF